MGKYNSITDEFNNLSKNDVRVSLRNRILTG